MTSKELLKLLEKHEQVCNARFDGINQKEINCDNRLWIIVTLIIVASGLEQLI